MNLGNKSIAGMVTTVLVTIVTLLLLVFGAIDYQIDKRHYLSDLRGGLTLRIDQLAGELGMALWNFNDPQIRRILESVMTDRAVFGVILEETRKIHVLSRTENWEISFGDKAFSGGGLLSEERPIVYAGDAIGRIRLFVTPKFILEDLRKHLITAVFMIVLIDLAMILSLYLMLRRSVLAPLKRVEQYALAVSSGKNAKMPASLFGAEFQSLGDSIQKMVDQLEIRFERLQQSESRFRVLVEQAPEAIVVYDADLGCFVDANSNAEQLFGCCRDELLKSGPQHFYSPEQPDGLLPEQSISSHVKQALAGESLIFERAILNAKGADLYCEVRLVKLPSKDHKLIRVSYIDITERKQAESMLVESQTRLQTLVRTIPDLVWLKDPDGVFLECNPIFERLYGAPRDQIIGKTDYDFVDKGLADFFRKNDQKAIAAGGPSTNEEWVRFADDGRHVLLETTKTPMVNNVGKLIGVLGIGHDITKRKELEKKLVQTQKMEAIGSLAGGIAHDFNNILAIIFGYTELALGATDPIRRNEHLQAVQAGAQRAKELVGQILTFGRKADQQKQPLRVALIIKEALKMLRASIPTTIEIRQSILSESSTFADPSQIHQIIMNLCTNAYHAMQKTGGVLAVSLKDVQIGTNDYEYAGLAQGAYLQLEVSDTGCGIPKESREKIFEPYYTTKKEEGTGIGLAVVHGIVKSHHGHITVYSEPGKGTTFHVYLPQSEQEADPAPEKAVENELRGRGERIMVVDDEEQICQVIGQLLGTNGYEVETFTSGPKALDAFQNDPQRFDLLFSDMTMPSMTGVELARQVLSVRSEMPIILCTGHSELINRDRALKIGITDFLNKPVLKEDILLAVRNALRKTP